MVNGRDYYQVSMDMRITKISENIQRLTANNGGVFTGPGTNTYLVGNDELTIIDPGPDLSDHIDDILENGRGRITNILIPPAHPDHSHAA